MYDYGPERRQEQVGYGLENVALPAAAPLQLRQEDEESRGQDEGQGQAGCDVVAYGSKFE